VKKKKGKKKKKLMASVFWSEKFRENAKMQNKKNLSQYSFFLGKLEKFQKKKSLSEILLPLFEL
jgi:hypothetical protein